MKTWVAIAGFALSLGIASAVGYRQIELEHRLAQEQAANLNALASLSRDIAALRNAPSNSGVDMNAVLLDRIARVEAELQRPAPTAQGLDADSDIRLRKLEIANTARCVQSQGRNC